MATVVPTITAENAHVYREQVERVEAFTKRLHIDLMDGIFTPNTSVPVDAMWWPDHEEVDVHLMHQSPSKSLEKLIELKPSLVIIPAESSDDLAQFAQQLNQAGIKAGLAVMPDTTVASVVGLLPKFQHLLIFSGNLGHQGGSVADLDLLEKVEEVKAINQELEIGWDGGANVFNIEMIVEAGVDVVNVGSAVQHAPDPVRMYKQLTDLA